MKKYVVKAPIAGYIYKEVEANSEEEAIDLALSDGWCYDELEELEMYNKVVEGNVCYLPYNKVEVKEIED